MNHVGSILNLSQLGIGFSNKEILKHINVEAKKSELIALIGVNGSGKSTLLRTIINLQKKISGSVEIFEKDVANYTPHELAKVISYVSTEQSGIEAMKVNELVELGRFPYTNWFGILNDDDKAIIEKAIFETGIESLTSKFVSELSDGERQRVMIARAVAQTTPVILLDEPSAFLDIPNKYALFKMLRKQTQENNKTIIFSTHDIGMAIEHADTFWVIDKNKLFSCSVEALIIENKLQDLFSEYDLRFSTEHLAFVQNDNYSFYVNLQGDSSLFLYTASVLRKNGIGVAGNKTGDITVYIEKNNDQIHWVIQKEKRNFVIQTILELIQTLKKEIS